MVVWMEQHTAPKSACPCQTNPGPGLTRHHRNMLLGKRLKPALLEISETRRFVHLDFGLAALGGFALMNAE